jgi:hypothetical protein
MAIENDVSVAVNGDIRYTGLDSGGDAGTYTVLELHRFLQDLADNQATTGDDLLDITSDTPSERATDNIITLNAPYNIDDNMAQYLYDGSIQQSGGDTLYSGLVVVGSVYGTTTLQVVQNNALYDGDSPFWGTGLNAVPAENILSQMLIKTRVSGSDIDGKRIRVFAREWGETFAEFSVTMGLGNSVAAIFTNQDLNNATAVGTVATWTTITNVEGYQLIDLSNGQGPQPYYSQWNRDIYTINQLYERAKYIVRRGSSEVIHGIDGDLFRGITHQWNYDNISSGADFTENDILTWGSGVTAGTGLLIAVNESGATGTMWIQLLTGVVPTDGMEIQSNDSAPETCDVDGSVVSRTVSPVFLGQSTGSAIIGGFGIGIESDDLTSADKLFDLTNTLREPPNNVIFYVYGLESGQDRVLVTNAQAGGIDFDQMTLGTALSANPETSLVIGSPSGGIPADTPSTGILRVQTDSGIYKYVAFTAHDSVDTFTINSDFSGDNASIGNNVLDKLAAAGTEQFTLIYNEDRTMFVRVRDGGGTPIKTFEATTPLSTGGGSATANRIDDT